MQYRPNRYSTARPAGFYAALHQQHAKTQAYLVGLRYAVPLELGLTVNVPKPRIKEMTAARKEIIERKTGKPVKESQAAHIAGMKPAYRPRALRRFSYPAFAPI
jgi:hypothetical protein